MANEIQPGLATFGQRSKTEAEMMPRVEAYLWGRPNTVSVDTAPVELQKAEDIDLLWGRRTKGGDTTTTVEVKVDTQIHKTGNFAFEVVVDLLKPKRGCIIRTTSDYLFYVCASTGKMWAMRTPAFQAWFIDEITSIAKLGTRKRRWQITTTNSAMSNGRYYTSVCYLVPEADLIKGLGDDLKIVELP